MVFSIPRSFSVPISSQEEDGIDHWEVSHSVSIAMNDRPEGKMMREERESMIDTSDMDRIIRYHVVSSISSSRIEPRIEPLHSVVHTCSPLNSLAAFIAWERTRRRSNARRALRISWSLNGRIMMHRVPHIQINTWIRWIPFHPFPSQLLPIPFLQPIRNEEPIWRKDALIHTR